VNEDSLKKQKTLRVIGFCIVGCVFLIGVYTVISSHYANQSQNNKKYVSNAELPFDSIDPKEIWVNQIRTENEMVQSKVDYIQELVVGNIKEEANRDNITQNDISDLKKEIEHLREELTKNQNRPNELKESLKNELKQVVSNNQHANFEPFVNVQESISQQEMIVPLTTVSCNELTNLHHVDRAIPAGTTVKAILLSSVDMPCGVRGSTDPLPVKLRVIADGNLPHNVKARLKSGIITASVYGDLSSERVYFRLEKLTQIKPDGYYIETQVAGYISGEDGKYGLRGTVVDKSCQLVENALYSGFLSGVSNFFEAAATSRLYPAGPWGGEAPDIHWGQTAGQLGIAGGSGGATNALDVLTDYFIKRAEQLRPVIQITPGRIVDITFSDSADLGDLYTHEKVRNSGKMEGKCGT